MEEPIDLSVVIPVTERYEDIESLYFEYKYAVQQTGLKYEFIYVLDGPNCEFEEILSSLKKKGEKIKIIVFAHWFGGATALKEGFHHCRGELILTLPAFRQAEPSSIPEMINLLEDNDVVAAWRYPMNVSILKKLQTIAYHMLLVSVTDRRFHDVGCQQMLLKKKVSQEIELYGDQHRFIALMAFWRGFKVIECQVPQSTQDKTPTIYAPGIYFRRMLDFLSIWFILKFTKKPLRFFGLLGMAIFGVGAVFALFLMIQRIFYGQHLAERPIIIIPAILISLGVHLFTAGLIGEIIIFTHARQIKEYTIDKIIN